MKEVTAYEDDCGKLHSTAKEALDADRVIRTKQLLSELMDEHGWNGMSKQDVIDIIMLHTDELKEALR